MKLIETVISEKSIQMLYGNAATKDESSEWLEAWVANEREPDSLPHLLEVHLGVLERARTILDTEIQRLRGLANRAR